MALQQIRHSPHRRPDPRLDRIAMFPPKKPPQLEGR
jgi:hypothetical protein